ncbi:MAG: hypothetical protein ACW98I_19500, partial [Candidatus Hodarchaeales archaeon]
LLVKSCRFNLSNSAICALLFKFLCITSVLEINKRLSKYKDFLDNGTGFSSLISSSNSLMR